MCCYEDHCNIKGEKENNKVAVERHYSEKGESIVESTHVHYFVLVKFLWLNVVLHAQDI